MPHPIDAPPPPGSRRPAARRRRAVSRSSFTRRSSELKSTRRERIRLVIRLSRLAEAHSIEVLRDPATSPHTELISILRGMARKGQSK